MNLIEFCETFKVSLPKARKMKKAGVLRLDETLSEQVTAIRHTMARGQPLTAMQLCHLIEHPKDLLDLGSHASRAQEQLREMGNAKLEAAPKHIAAHISDAARSNKQAASLLASWIKQVIPRDPVTHSYLAVRLLLGLPENVRKFDVGRIPRAMMEVRKLEEFSGWFEVHVQGKKTFTIYKRPSKKALANLDL